MFLPSATSRPGTWKLYLLTITIILSIRYGLDCINMPTQKSDSFQRVDDLSVGILQFGQKLNPIINGNGAMNIVYSPLSIHSALSMLILGLKHDNRSQEILLDNLGSDNSTKIHQGYREILREFRSITKQTAEATGSRLPVLDFWTMATVKNATNLKSSFRSNIDTFYNTSIKQIDNERVAQDEANSLNDWARRTGFNDNLVKPDELLCTSEGLNLISAVGIRASWVRSLYERNQSEIFYNFGESKKPVAGIALAGSELHGHLAIFTKDPAPNRDFNPRSRTDDEELNQLEFRMVQIGLKGNLTFTIIEPLKNGTGNELKELESALDLPAKNGSSLMVRALDILSTKPETFVRFQMPKFRFDNDINLKMILSSIGLSNLFSASNEELSEISDRPMFIERASHQSFIEVDKNGLRGGAMTRVSIAKLSLMIYDHPINIIVKHPFRFIVRYKSLVLLMGRVVEV